MKMASLGEVFLHRMMPVPGSGRPANEPRNLGLRLRNSARRASGHAALKFTSTVIPHASSSDSGM